MTNSNNIILSGKYQILKQLGNGSTSTVYLARHLTLKSDRAIKVIPKTVTSPLTVLSEALLLKSMHHPGIPIIYDIEEDDQNFYLVEEYIKGESLEVFLLHQQFISPNLFLSFCEQLCSIFHYLHSLHPIPILYQDLKPEHIIVCGMQLKLIDFGDAHNAGSAGNKFKHFGNAEFSAPENLVGDNLSIAADIYSLGKIIQFLASYFKDPIHPNLSHIIQKATSANPAQRFETVEALEQAIRSELTQKRQLHLCKSIAIIGSFKGCGCTHLAISLVCTCNHLGHQAFYHGRDSSDSLRKMLPQMKHVREQNGYYMYKDFKGYPVYGPGISIPESKDAIHIYDMGSQFDLEDLQSADVILLICGSSLWHWNDAIEKEEILHQMRDRILFICNPGNTNALHFYAKQFGAPVYSYFFDSDAFLMSEDKRLFLDQILHKKGRAYPFFHLHPQFHVRKKQ